MTAAGAAALAVLLAGAQARAQGVDDSDLSVGRGPRPKVALEGRLEGRTLAFPLTGAGPAGQGAAPPGSVSGTFLLPDRQGGLQPARQASAALVGPDGKAGRTIPVSADGSWALPIDAALSGTFRVRLTLGGALWSFEDPGTRAGYAWDSPGFTLPSPEPVRLGALSPAPGSENAKVGLIHLTYLETLDAFERHGVGRGWWDRTLTVYWPDGSDYFSSWGFELHLTAPEAWDVNLHELGHAVMHAAMRAAGAGGPHKIDDCYGPALAWSEGWATFFAAAVHLEPSDPDARFEFLVPRRAPIRLENVPEDVCRGQANEWRVAAALWDLYDSHPDGADASSLPLGRLWTAWEGQRMGSLADYLKRLAPKLSPSERAAADASLRQNTMDEAVPPGGNLASRLPLSAPRFDPR